MIILERFESAGPWGLSYGKSSLLERQIYSDRIEDIPWSFSEDSIEDQILSCKLDGKISRELTGETLQESGLIKTGPLETRFASRLMQIALDRYLKGPLSKTDRSDLNLVCAVEPQGSITGYRNGLRLGHNFNGDFNESLFIKNLDKIFKDVHPIMSLHNMPNQMAGNLAINFELGGETINVAGRNSSFEAFNSAIRLVKTNKNEKALLVGAFCYRPSLISNLLYAITGSSLNSLKVNSPVLNEWVGVGCIRRSNKPRKGNMAIRGVSGTYFSSVDLISDTLLNLIEGLLRSARVDINELNLVLINDASSGWFTDQVLNIQSFKYRFNFVDTYQRLGFGFHCGFLQSLELAQIIFDKGMIPGKLREGHRDSMFFSGIQHKKQFFNSRYILLVSLGFPNQIQLVLLDGANSK